MHVYLYEYFSEFWIFYYHKIFKGQFLILSEQKYFFWVLVIFLQMMISINSKMLITNEFQTADKDYNLCSMPVS